MSKPSISVIIPCYNGWRYMRRCLDALEKQTVEIDEIVIVDDCSTDNSVERINEYASTSSLNIIVAQNETNRGPGKAREKGISIAKSDYVAFCDCDDWYEYDFAENIKSIIERDSADIIVFDTFTAFSSEKKAVDHVTTELQDKDRRYILAHYPMSLCRMTVKKRIIEKVHHTDLRHAEDGVVVAQLIAQAGIISVLDKPLYNYYFREDSASKKPNRNTSFDLLEAYKEINHYVDNTYESEKEFIGINYVCYGAILCGLKSGVRENDLSAILDTFEKESPEWENNKYLSELGKAKRVFLKLTKRRRYVVLLMLAKIHPILVRIKKRLE